MFLLKNFQNIQNPSNERTSERSHFDPLGAPHVAVNRSHVGALMAEKRLGVGALFGVEAGAQGTDFVEGRRAALAALASVMNSTPARSASVIEGRRGEDRRLIGKSRDIQ